MASSLSLSLSLGPLGDLLCLFLVLFASVIGWFLLKTPLGAPGSTSLKIEAHMVVPLEVKHS
jgi:UPF0716 family protein affecting phage T7 exclusion